MNVFERGIICAVKDDNDLSIALDSQCHDIFLLRANINTVNEVVKRCHEHGKRVFVHIDLAEGFGKDEASIEYVANVVRPDGVLSTKINIIKIAKEYGLVAVYRVFLIDQQSMDSAVNNIKKFSPTAIEIMPGIAYEAISQLSSVTTLPIIAGGFVRTMDSANKAFESGAIACSSSNRQLWQDIC